MPTQIKAAFGNQEQHVNIGISDKDRKEVAKGLSKCLADSYLLYLKTQNYHWNVTGPLFTTLHELFEKQYTELIPAIDTIAERIRALGEFSPGSLTSFSKLTAIKEETTLPAAEEMVAILLHDNETVVRTLRETITLTDQCEDDVTADLLVQRMNVHEKAAWMLRSILTSRQSAPQRAPEDSKHA